MNIEHPPTLILPRRTLLVLCGPAGSGKSTFAQQVVAGHEDFYASMIVSSDKCRALICDDETNQQVNRDTFDLFYYIIAKRMDQNRFTIADSTALLADARRRLLELAQSHRYSKHLLIFNISRETCLQHDQQRQRRVGEQVIAYHIGLLKQTLQQVPSEPWDKVSILDEQHQSLEILVK